MPGGTAQTATAVPDRLTHAGRRQAAIRWMFPDLQGRLTTLGDERITTFGRDPECSVLLPGNEVSRCHAEIVAEGGRLTVRDRQSKNGVFVNGKKIDEEALLPGSVIRIGEWIGILLGKHDEGESAAGKPFHEPLPGLLVGPVLAAVLGDCKRAAQSDLPIVIEGETGTGKERIARAIHAWSARREAPFVAVNCAAIPENLAEAELFGFRKGAFTGADKASSGFIRSAHTGTLLLDEIVDMPLPIQAKLLRALEQQEVVPLGEAVPIPIDVRVIAAAQSSLRGAVEEKRFRPDLAARLDGLTVRLPPLRERMQEVPYLFVELLKKHLEGVAGPILSPQLIELLCLYQWPLNVRELDLLVRRLITLHGDAEVWLPTHLPPQFSLPPEVTPSSGARPPAKRANPTIDELTRALRGSDGNLARAAESLGLTRQRAYRMLRQAGLDVEQLRLDAKDKDPVEVHSGDSDHDS